MYFIVFYSRTPPYFSILGIAAAAVRRPACELLRAQLRRRPVPQVSDQRLQLGPSSRLAFPQFRTRITTCYPNRVDTGPCFRTRITTCCCSLPQAIGAVVFVFVVILLQTRSLVLTLCGFGHIVLSLPLGQFLYGAVLRIHWVGVLSGLPLFIIMGIRPGLQNLGAENGS